MKKHDTAVLLIGFLRREFLLENIRKSVEFGYQRIYVALDGPRTADESRVTNSVLSAVKEFAESCSIPIFLLARDANVGCAVSVMAACDWVFRNEQRVVILEDDCLPTLDFFNFVDLYIEKLEESNDVFVICGTQVLDLEVPFAAYLSKYALTWGGATTRVKWNQLRELAFDVLRDTKGKENEIHIWERIYWNAGARRALRGYADAWDTIMVAALRLNGFYSILPTKNLVTNRGDDEYATHTLKGSIGLNTPISSIEMSGGELLPNAEIDYALKRNFYKIRFRHMFTTQITRMRDAMRKKYLLESRLGAVNNI